MQQRSLYLKAFAQMQIRIFFLEFFCYNLRLLLKEHVRSYVNRLKTQTMNLKAIFNHFKSSAKWNSMIKRDCHSIGMYMKYNHKTSDVKIEINKCGGLNSSSAWPFHRITQSNRHTHIYIYILLPKRTNFLLCCVVPRSFQCT